MGKFHGLFHPRGVAVIGASSDLARGGGQPVNALLEFGYRGEVYPVNPKRPEIGGVRCYASVAEIEGPCDLAVIVLTAAGVYGKAPRDVAALAATVNCVSRLAWDLRTSLMELDVNPLFVLAAGEGAVAGDALAVLEGGAA